MKSRSLLVVAAWLIGILAASAWADSGISKFMAKAGETESTDQLQILGVLDALAEDLDAADEIVIALESADMQQEFMVTIDEDSYKKGRFKDSFVQDECRQMLQYNPQNGKLLFTAKNVDLTGLACPVTVTVTIGGYSESFELDEEVVNGPKPCPPQFLMGLRNGMIVDKAQVRQSKKPGTDIASIKGFFTVADDYDTANPMILRLGSQNFTVAGDAFVHKGFVESCNKAVCQEGAQVKAEFDFSKCLFHIQVSDAVIADSGPMDVQLNCFGHELPGQTVEMASTLAPRYDLERYRCYNQLGREWVYSAQYSIEDSEGMTNESGTLSTTLSVADTPVVIDGQSGYSIFSSIADSVTSSTWYEDYYGTHMCSWGNVEEMMFYNAEMDALLAMPSLMAVGQTHKTSGNFAGDFELDTEAAGMDMDIYDFKGTASVQTTLLGFEPVSVPYGDFDDAAKVSVTTTLKGSMIIEVDYYGIRRLRFKFQAILDQTWWGVQDLGIVKADSDMTIKISGAGENIWVSLDEIDELTQYSD